jgi:hypothetical protein
MSELLAVLEEHQEPDEVLGLAAAVAALLSVKVRRLLVPASEASAFKVLAALEEDSVNAAVLRGEPDPDALFWEVIQQSAKPVVVTPFGAADLSRPIARVLLPLDGTPETAKAVAPTARQLLAGGTAVVATHVFDKSTVPAFWDQAAHSHEPWTREFLRRNLPAGDRLNLRHGRPPEEIMAESVATGSDLILLGWSQRLAGDRAPTVRLALEGNVPLMLVGTE